MEGRPQPPPLGTLIFSCNGRGINLYGEPNYDSTTLASFVPVPTSGMFCNGVPLGWVVGGCHRKGSCLNLCVCGSCYGSMRHA